MQLYAPTHQDSSRFDGKVSHVPANTPGQLKVQWSSIAMSARNYISSKLNRQTSLCPPESISAQSSMVKRRYVRQKLHQLKVKWSNVAVSSRSYISSNLRAKKQVTHKINPRRRVSHPCQVDWDTIQKINAHVL